MGFDALLQAATFLQVQHVSRETGGAPIRKIFGHVFKEERGVCGQGRCTAVVLLDVWQRTKQGEWHAP